MATALGSIGLLAVLALPTVCQGDFVLQPPVSVTPSRFAQFAVSDDGQHIVASWSAIDAVEYRVSRDGGRSFAPTEIALQAPRSRISGLYFDVESGTAPVISATGTDAHIFAGLEIQTDPFDPPPGLPPALRVSSMGLYGSSDLSGLFGKEQKITALSDRCVGPPGLRCSSLREFHMVSDDAARVYLAVWNAFGFDGQDGETWFARGDAEQRDFAAPINLSEAVLPTPDGNDFRPRITASGDGEKVFVTWEEVPPADPFRIPLARSLDGGQSWSLATSLEASAPDVEFARSVGRLIWAYHIGFFFADPLNPSRIEVRLSDDFGTTFGAPTLVAEKMEVPGGTHQVQGPVRVAASNDGSVIAVLYAQEYCDSIFGCTGGSVNPYDIVLSVSEDSGASYERLGVVARTHFKTFQPYDVAVQDDGSTVFVVSNSIPDTVLVRAVRR